MPSLRNLPVVQISGAQALANRPSLPYNEQIRRHGGLAIESGLQSEDSELLHALGFTANGVLGQGYRGLVASWIKSWGVTNGNQILIDADFANVFMQVPYIRNRIPDIALKNLRIRAQQLIAAPVDPQVAE